MPKRTDSITIRKHFHRPVTVIFTDTFWSFFYFLLIFCTFKSTNLASFFADKTICFWICRIWVTGLTLGKRSIPENIFFMFSAASYFITLDLGIHFCNYFIISSIWDVKIFIKYKILFELGSSRSWKMNNDSVFRNYKKFY